MVKAHRGLFSLQCLFKGANVPYVLRLMGEEFALIGEAYLHGLMQDEALDRENLE
jgi:hypothetical protein